MDPVQLARNIAGLGNASQADSELWVAFHANPEGVAAEAEAAYARLSGRDAPPLESEIDLPEGPTEVTRAVRTRRVQAFFRAAVLTSYDYRCALSDIVVPGLLNASHIIPWRDNTARRADPRNGIALNALYDRAFDQGLITFDESLRLVVSPRLRDGDPPLLQQQALLELEQRELRLPQRFSPDPVAMAYHRARVFR
jgi:predicted restriction endonuclease